MAVSKLVNAAAYPGPYAVFILPSDIDLGLVNCFDQLCDVGIVVRLAPTSFQLSMLGFQHVVHYRRCQHFQPVLEVRAIAASAWTTYELMSHLMLEDWTILPEAGRKPVPLKLENAKPEHKKVYFNKVGLDVNRSYLQCLVQLDELRTRGSFHQLN